MNTRLEQDAHDSLQAFELRQKFIALERARWALSAPKKCTSVWAPVLTEQQKQEQQQYVIDNNLPF